MKIQEFLEELKNALSGEMPQSEVFNNLKFYQDYMEQQKGNGKKEEEITEALGDPRLIARTIIDTFQLNTKTTKRYDQNNTYQKSFYESSYSTFDEDMETQKNNKQQEGYSKIYHMPIWAIKLIACIILILIISFVFFLGSLAIKIFFRIGLPLLLIYFVYQFVKDYIKKK